MTISVQSVGEYFARYAAALTSFDAELAASLWSMPAMITTDEFSGVITSRTEMAAGVAQSYPLYQRLGLASTEFEALEQHDLTELLALVKIRWIFLAADRRVLTDSTSYYLLRDEQGTIQACTCIETDSAEKLQELAARLGVDLTG